MSDLTPLPLPEGLRWIKLVCRLGRLAHDGPDPDDKPDLLPTAGKVRLASSPARLRVQETDGRWRSVSLDDREYTIRADGELVDAEGRVGVWIPDPASALLDPRPYTLVATVTPTVGERWAARLTGEALPDVVDIVAHSETVAVPASAVPGLSSRIASLEGILADGGAGFPDGAVPIFETLAQAESWEAANPGRVALTLEAAAEPDTTPPEPGTLTITPAGTTAQAQVTGASDDSGSIEYAFRLDSGAWSQWQQEPMFTFSGLSVSTSYSAQHRVRDMAGNVADGYAEEFETLDVDPWGTTATDSFNRADGPLIGSQLESGGLTWAGALKLDGSLPTPNPADGPPYPSIVDGQVVRGAGLSTVDGAYWSTSRNEWLASPNESAAYGGLVELPVTPSRVRMELRCMPGSGGYENRIWFVIGGTSQSAYGAVCQRNFNGPRYELSHTGALGVACSYGTIQTWASVDQADQMAYATPSTIVVEHEGDQLSIYQDDARKLAMTLPSPGDDPAGDGRIVPAGTDFGGRFYGFMIQSNNESGWVDDFSIQWE